MRTNRVLSSELVVGAIGREDFSCDKYEEHSSLELQDFFLTVSLFQGWSPYKILSLVNNSFKIRYKMGQLVYNEKDVPEYIFIVYRGDFVK